jgi:hypothetical protein
MSEHGIAAGALGFQPSDGSSTLPVRSKDHELLVEWLKEIWKYRGPTKVHYGWWQTVLNKVEQAGFV